MSKGMKTCYVYILVALVVLVFILVIDRIEKKFRPVPQFRVPVHLLQNT